VWLDGGDDGPDKGNTSPDFCRTSTAAEVFENDGECPDSENTGYNKCTCIWKGNYFPTFPGSERQVGDGASASLSVCDPGSGEVQKQDRDISRPIDKNPSQEPQLALPRTISAQEKCGSIVQLSGSPPPQPPPSTDRTGVPRETQTRPPVPARSDRPLRIDARDYKPLVPPEKRACDACGAPWSFYVEKLTDERRRRKDKTARRICKACYSRARQDAREHATVLPGTFDLARAERLRAGVGRCTVCDLDPAAYADRATGTKLCEFCFQRFAGKQGSGEAGA